MTLRKITGFIHLWLGLISGLVVITVALTGCIYAFEKEIQNKTQSYRFVEREAKPMLPPSKLREIADKALPGKKIHSVEYGNGTSAIKAVYYNYEPEYYYLVYLNPYSGKVLKVKSMDHDFFRIILEGHYYLWLPPAIGKPVVAVSTLIFVLLLLTGIILWWPNSKGALRQGLSLKWNAGIKRKNYDLHNVLGFYVLLFALVIALTGLVWGFEWFAKSAYSLASGGKKFVEYSETFSVDSVFESRNQEPATDRILKKVIKENPHAKTIEVHFPETSRLAIGVSINTDPSVYWKTDYRYYDQNTLSEIQVSHMYGRYHANLTFADKLMRMNYDIHVGAILGLPGKLLAFFVSLICASLPVTGFYIWWNKRKQKRFSLVHDLE